MTIYGRSEELVSRCVECDLAEPESLASLGGSAPGLVDGILSNKKGVLEPSGDLYWPTFHSYWHDKHKNLCLHFFVVLPSGCRAEQGHDSEQKEDQHRPQVAQLSV